MYVSWHGLEWVVGQLVTDRQTCRTLVPDGTCTWLSRKTRVGVDSCK